MFCNATKVVLKNCVITVKIIKIIILKHQPLLFLDDLSIDGNNITSTTEENEVFANKMDYNGSNHMYLDEVKSSTHNNSSEECADESKLLLLLFNFFIINYYCI